jgi:hypothetical protein
MTTITFDTLAFATRLKNAGCEPKLAEEQAKAQAEILTNLVENSLVTKDDMSQLVLKVDRLGDKVESLEDKLDTRLIRLEDKLNSLSTTLFIKLAGVIIGTMGFIGVSVGILSKLHII